MQFTPRTEDELQRESLCPDGLQAFTVMSAAFHTSKTGNESLKVKINIHGSDGNDYHAYDYISPEGRMAYKFRHFFAVIDRIDIYERGNITAQECEDITGLSGWCMVGVKPAKDGFKAANRINDYCPQRQAETGVAPERVAKAVSTKQTKVEPSNEDDPFAGA